MTNPDNVGGLLPCPFCGGAAERIDFGPGSGDNEGGSCIACTKCQASGPVEFGYKENFVSNWNRRELCRAAPAGGDYRGVIPQVLDETINGVVSDLEMIAAGKDQVTGDPVSGLQSQRIAKAAHDRLLSAWNACDSAPAGSGEASRMDAVYNFLMGIADLDGVSFGELHPNKRGRFWWRHELAAAYAILRKLQQGADGWIAASERLPERIEGTAHSAEVLVSDGKRVWIHCAYFDWKACERDYWGDTPYVPRLGSGATHWRPLPHASQGQEGGKP